MKSRIVCFLYLIVCLYISSNRDQVGRHNNYHYDINGYYIYLPAIFIYQDLSHFHFQDSLNKIYDTEGGDNYGLTDVNGNRINKYAIGTAISELPFFLIAHAYCSLSGSEKTPADGYSTPYEYALVFSAMLWPFLGLLVLRRYLLRYFTENTVAIVLLCIGLGTNIYTYTVFTPGMSHNFSFFLFASLLLYTDNWYRSQKRRDICVVAFILGLITITRPVNLIAIFIPLLWGVYNKESLIDRIRTFTVRRKDVLFTSLCFLLIAGIQVAYWKYITGKFFYFSYVGEEFNFSEPKIWKGLFSYRKGWFIYTPVAFIGLIGLFFTPRRYLASLILFFSLMIYVVFSWENWYYGGGFGARAMIETLPVIAVPLAFLTTRILERMPVIVKAPYLLILVLAVILNIFQSYQYSYGMLDHTRMSRDYYWAIFGRLHNRPEYKQYLMPEEEFYHEIEEWQNN